jgi:hypothetical protein
MAAGVAGMQLRHMQCCRLLHKQRRWVSPASAWLMLCGSSAAGPFSLARRCRASSMMGRVLASRSSRISNSCVLPKPSAAVTCDQHG